MSPCPASCGFSVDVALPALAADELHVFVFGPGTGELVAVRAPPEDWLIGRADSGGNASVC